MAENVKTAQGLAIASVKTLQGLAIADAKTIMGVDNTSGGSPEWYESIAPASTDTDDTNSEFGLLQPITAGQSGNCTKLSIYCSLANSTPNNIKLELYDNSNPPNLLVATSDPTKAISADSWIDIDCTPTPVTGSTVYRVGEMHSEGNSGLVRRYLAGQPANSSYLDFATAFGSWPIDPQNSLTGTTRLYAVRMYIEP